MGGWYLKAQNIESVVKQDPVTINGNIVFDQMVTPNSNEQGKWYTYYLTGQINSQLYGISLPVTFNYSNQDFGFKHPFAFNQFGAQPEYKWLKLFVGYNSLSYSPFTLNGHQINGIGFEIKPNKIPITFSAIYGRLLKATDYSDTMNTIPSYKRMGGGIKLSTTLKNISASTSIFYAHDNTASILPPPDSLGITPKENLSYNLQGNIQITKRLTFDFDLGNSILTDDITSPKENKQKFLGNLYTYRTSTSSSWAYKGNLNYNINIGSLGIGYERIAPNFRTLGAYYNTNDYENYTANITISLFKGRLNMTYTGGLQRDNLEEQKVLSNRRFVNSTNISSNLSDKINFTLNYSTFNSFTNARSVFDEINANSPYANLDTLNFTQINRSGTANLNYLFGSESNPQSISTSVNINQSISKHDNNSQKGDMIMLNGSVNHSVNINKSWILVASLFYSRYNIEDGVNSTIGPLYSITKILKDKRLKAGLASTINKSWINDKAQSTNYNIRLNGNWEFYKGHQVSISAGYLYLKPHTTGLKERSSLTINISYNYQFNSVLLKRKDKQQTDETAKNSL